MKQIGAWLAQTAAWGPWGAFLIAFGDSAFVPLPQGVDALLIAHAIASPSTAYLAAACAVAGSLLGSLILYSMARKAGRAMLGKKMSEEAMAKMERRMSEYGSLAVIPPMAIPLPLPTKIFVMAAGVFQMNVLQFAAATLFGRSLRYFGEAALALRFGDETAQVLKDNALLAVALAAAVVASFVWVNRWSSRRVAEG